MMRTDRPDHTGSIHVALQIKRGLLGFIGMGFLGLTIDVFLEHYFTMHSMRQPQWIPIVFGPLGGAVTGGLGLYYRGMAVARNLESLLDLLDWQTLFAVLPHAPPLGAPMAFVGMGVLGLLVPTCTLKLEHLVRPRSLAADALFALAFLLLVLAPLSPMLIHVLF